MFSSEIFCFFDSPIRSTVFECIQIQAMHSIKYKNDSNSIGSFRIQFYPFKHIHKFINSKVQFNFNVYNKNLLPATLLFSIQNTYLLEQFGKHMVDSVLQLHFVPSMIKFHSPVKKIEKNRNEHTEKMNEI